MPLSTDSSAPETEDLAGYGAVSKTILEPGTGDAAGRNAKVGVRYSLRLSEDDTVEPFDSSAKRPEGVLCFSLGRGKVIPALEVVARSMKVGEKCKARTTAPYAFGKQGLKRKGVPPNAVVYMEVEMVMCEGGEKKKPLADMSPKERFDEAKTYKEHGNNFFKEQRYEKALDQYGRSIRLLADVFYKPASSLPSVNESSVTEKSAEVAQESTDAKDEEGFEEAEVLDADANGQIPPAESEDAPDANGASSEQLTQPSTLESNEERREGTEQLNVESNAVSEEPVPGETNVDEPPANGLRIEKEGENDQDEVITAVEEEEEVIETIDVSTVTSSTPEDAGSRPSEATTNKETEFPVEAEGQSTVEPETTSGAPSDSAAITVESDDPEEDEVRALHVTTLNNLSLCHVKLEDYKRAVESTSVALKIDPQSSKALYYRYGNFLFFLIMNNTVSMHF